MLDECGLIRRERYALFFFHRFGEGQIFQFVKPRVPDRRQAGIHRGGGFHVAP